MSIFNRANHLSLCLLTMLLVLSARAEEAPDAWDRVLGAVGLTRETTRFDFLDMASYGGHEFLLPFFDAVHREPLRIPFYTRVLKHDFQSAAPSAGELAMAASWRMGEGTRRTLIGNPLEEFEKQAAAPGALLNAIVTVHQSTNSKLSKRQLASLTTATKTVPEDIARSAALLLYAEVAALEWRNRALMKWQTAHGTNLQPLFDHLTGADKSRKKWNDEIAALMYAIDMKFMMAGGIDLALAVDQAANALNARTANENFTFDWETPLGFIALRGSQNDVYPSRPYLLIIDSSGSDEYSGGGASWSATHPVSVLLDVQGDDRYLHHRDLLTTPVAAYEKRKEGGAPLFGAGVLGYGLLVDLQGDDLYRSLSNSQGSGLYGMGILQDRGGNDRYDAYTASQGAATFGIGVLSDLEGTDEYRCFTTSQGFGATKGCGALIDAGEDDDVFEANDTVIDFPSPQDKRHNATLAQGAGYGRRADYSDGHSLAGGVGVLVDSGGNNTFTSGVYGQGTGYWYALGVLCSGSGNDTYRGVWYVQGAQAHFAVGVLHDAGGNDNYVATHNMAQGAGHDFGTGFLIDESGNDRYEAPNLSLGGGNANGFGFFWDKAGDDVYQPRPSTTLGRASIEAKRPLSLRDRNLTLGIFLDTGGNDTYPEKIPQAKNNSLWTMADNKPAALPVARGAGLDTETVGNLE